MIRPYHSRDADAVVEVWYAAASAAYDFVPGEFWPSERDALRNTYLPMAQTWVYEQGGVVVGFLSLLGDEVGGLFVLPACQGQGFGTRLLQHARALRGSLFLDVFAQNVKARRFYEGCGFVVTGESMHEATGCIMLTMQSR